MQRTLRWGLAALAGFFSVGAAAALVAEYRMDAPSWAGVAGEVLDSSGNGFHGVANQATTGSGVFCRAADLSATSTADYLDLDYRALDGLTDFTVMLWYQSTNTSRPQLISAANTGDEKELYWQTRNGDRFSPEIKNDRDGDVRISDIDDGQWHHLAWSRNGRDNCFYVDGALQDCNRLANGALDVDPTGFIVGQELDNLGYEFQNNRGVEALLDELYIFDSTLSQSAINLIRVNNLAGLNWDGSTRACATIAPRGAYYFDEPSWSGVADEVLDASGNNFHGVAVATDTTDGYLCRAADLSASGTADYLSLNHQALDGVSDFTLSAWIRSSKTGNKALLSAARAGQANEIIFWFANAFFFQPHIDNRRVNIFTPNFWDGSWHHVTWTHSAGNTCFYLDGNLRGCNNLIGGTRRVDVGGLIIGQEQDTVGGAFLASQAMEGLLDELLIFGDALSAAQVLDIYNNNTNGLSWDGAPRTCIVSGAASFRITHDGAGIFCAAEPVAVRALDGGGNPATSYTGRVVLDTGTGRGDWSLSGGSGVLNNGAPDDGVASYTFDPLDAGEAFFSLSYTAGSASMDLEVYDSGDTNIRDDDTEGPLTFSPSGFTVTANPVPNPPAGVINDPLISNNAGVTFPVHLTAYGVTEDDPICGVIEDYTGLKTVSAWQDYVDPGSGSLQATVNAVAIGNNLGSATALPIVFLNGQAVVTAKYKDVGRVRLNFAESGFSGSTDSFVSRPASLLVRSVTDASGAANPGASTPLGPGFAAAGEPFNVTVDVVDAEGDRTPNFGNETSPEGISIQAATLVVPLGGRRGSGDDGVMGNGNLFSATATPGQFANTTVYFDEVGVVQLQAQVEDGSYLSSGAVLGPLTGNVGRFYPHHFELTAASLSSACTDFVYMPAPHIGIQADIAAHTLAGNITQNYGRTLLGGSGVATVVGVAEHQDNGTDLGGRLSFLAPAWQSGQYTLNVTDASFSRLVTPDGAYESLNFVLKVVDTLDNRSLSLTDLNADTSGLCTLGNSCSAVSIGNLDVYFGRLAVLPAQGPENENLSVDLEAQIYQGGVFIEHVADQCSTYLGADGQLQNYRGNLGAGDTVILGPASTTALVDGHSDPTSPLLLSAPGLSKEGIVELELTVPAWLQDNWSGSGSENPRADATFGRFRGHDRIIYWRQDP